ncbi:unnamed protein product [Thelazia callipaeda]|uniref:RING-type E3 ubiquitin transferase n=1 Tax=Thelazia callipaeda TaxID=103827 RepID=A0A0N5CWL5_THECL|nr:unnamed protein product [Thelazia callipaeda]
METAKDVPVQRLVVDSSAFIKRAPLHELGSEIYTVPGVIDELKCEKMRHLLASLPFEIQVQEPSRDSLHIITEFSKKTGDYPSLSAVDLKLLSLTHDLHLELCGASSLNYEFKGTEQYETHISSTKNESESYSNINNTDNDITDQRSSDSDCGTWLDENNVDELLQNSGEEVVPVKDLKVACITSDFAMQNILLRLGLNLLSINGYKISRLKNYILRCRACFATTANMTKRFCHRCGNDSLHRVAVSINEDGTMQLHINWDRLKSARGLKHSLPAPKGGKHAVGPQLFEDQPIPQNRMARCHQDATAGPFVMKDVTSSLLSLNIVQRTPVKISSMSTFYCHSCEQAVSLRDGDFVCARCGGEFIEELSVGNSPSMSPFEMIFGQFISDRTPRNTNVVSSSDTQQNENQEQQPQPSSIRFPMVPGEDDNVVVRFLNQLLSDLSAQGTQVQLQITREPNAQGTIFHGLLSDYAFGENGLDQIVTQLLNQFEGGSTPVDPKLLANLPMTTVEKKHIESDAQCTTCMETFKENEVVAILDCQHIFHRECILPWLTRSDTCPVCRKTVDATKWRNINPMDELD